MESERKIHYIEKLFTLEEMHSLRDSGYVELVQAKGENTFIQVLSGVVIYKKGLVDYESSASVAIMLGEKSIYDGMNLDSVAENSEVVWVFYPLTLTDRALPEDIYDLPIRLQSSGTDLGTDGDGVFSVKISYLVHHM